MERWGSGLGLRGEQGIETTHLLVNGLKPCMKAIRSGRRRLKSFLEEYFMCTEINRTRLTSKKQEE
jgi:hypothetical protein